MKKRYSKKTPWAATRYVNAYLIRAVELYYMTGRTQFSTSELIMKSDHDKLSAIGVFSDPIGKILLGQLSPVDPF